MNKSIPPSTEETPLYRELEHTGDIGIEVSARTRSELFRRAALALAALLVETSTVAAKELHMLQISANDDVAMLHDLLSELLQLFAADGFIWRNVVVEESPGALQVIVEGEYFDSERHSSRGEIKAVTYHQMSVEELANEWRARIIFDV